MEYLIGVILTLAVAAFAFAAGFDRERAFAAKVMRITRKHRMAPLPPASAVSGVLAVLPTTSSP
jgi:hypothetical protein